MFGTILIIFVLALAIFASIAAWLNTRTILRDLSKIKAELGGKEEKTFFLDNDLDSD
jgi:hypothetical protein